MRRTGLALALAAALLVPRAAAGASGAPAARRLAVVPFYSPEQMWRLYEPFVEYLRRATGERWELSLHASHEALVEEFCAGRVDVALVGPIPLGRLERRCGASPFLLPVGPGGSTTYRSVLLTADPTVGSVAALRGKDVGFFRDSTAAHVLPVKLLSDAGLSPGSYRAVFLESQDRLVAAILAGTISAAGVKSALSQRCAAQPGLRVLATSEPLPSFSFAALPSLPAATRERFVAALLALRPTERAQDAELVRSWDDEVRYGFVLPPPDFLPSVRALVQLTERVQRDAG